jgi:hypothetical protein
MRLKLFACFAMALGLAWASNAVAAPINSPFLSVDINGYNAGGGQTIGPTVPGFDGWEMAEGLFLDPLIDWPASGAAGLTKVFATTQGPVTANLIGVGISRGARNRGANTDALGGLTQDFVFSQRDGAIGFGRNYNKLTLSGLTPSTQYEFTGWARDHFNGGTDSFQAWTDRALLGGADGPSAWLDANVSPGASYSPAPGGTNNTIPHYTRSPVSGPAGADAYTYATTFLTSSNASGVIEVYTWADPNSFSGVQGASLLNGFLLGPGVPEPASFGLLVLGLVGISGIRRRIG